MDSRPTEFKRRIINFSESDIDFSIVLSSFHKENEKRLQNYGTKSIRILDKPVLRINLPIHNKTTQFVF